MGWPSQVAEDVRFTEKGLFFRRVVKLWGVPTSIVSDKVGRFISMFQMENILKIPSLIDSQIERFNCMFEEYLRHFVDVRQKNWVQLLEVAQLCFNAQTSSSIGRSSFKIVYGRQPVLQHLVDHPCVRKNLQFHNFTKEWKQTTYIARVYLKKASRWIRRGQIRSDAPLSFRRGIRSLSSDNYNQLDSEDPKIKT